MNFLQSASDLLPTLIAIRRHIHQNPELGFELPNTVALVKEKLTSFGITPTDIGNNGVTALIGKQGGKVILLRADMDALPIKEQSGLDFSATGDNSHTCGHDIHTTILLGVAKLLKDNEEKLNGMVKLIFQPAEELLVGGQAMVDAGILQNPKVDVAAALHTAPNAPFSGIGVCGGAMLTSANNFRITIKGVGSHGAMPFNGIDPVYIGSQIVVSAPEIIARELPFNEGATITMGGFNAKGAVNVIPDTAIIEGTVRTFHNSTREYIKKRLPELVQNIATTYRGTASLEFLSDCPVLINDEQLTEQLRASAKNTLGDSYPVADVPPLHGSEDFAFYTNQVPSVYFLLANPSPNDKGEVFAVHHPQVRFDEKMMAVGVATMAGFAVDWLNGK